MSESKKPKCKNCGLESFQHWTSPGVTGMWNEYGCINGYEPKLQPSEGPYSCGPELTGNFYQVFKCGDDGLMNICLTKVLKIDANIICEELNKDAIKIFTKGRQSAEAELKVVTKRFKKAEAYLLAIRDQFRGNRHPEGSTAFQIANDALLELDKDLA